MGSVRIARNLHLKNGSYYFVGTIDGRIRWVWLGRTREEADAAYFLMLDGPDEAMRRHLMKAVRNSRQRAKRRGVDHSLTCLDVFQAGAAARWTCAVSGLPFSLASSHHTRRPWAPSLDRIDNASGYTAGNVRLVCSAVNYAMNEWGEGPLRRIARALIRQNSLEPGPPA